jgi:ssDNA-binding Zn-finger/Zn-ribbon topoisomerase 1
MPDKRAIEEYFPIVEINRLAEPERVGSGVRPIYSMGKWFARRASCVFRAILLGCLKPAGTDIMAEFYKDHTNDPDTNGKVVLDPFMGGGTTVVEALRLGCKVIGIDLNPVAWFITKTEVEPVDIEELKAAFQRLAERIVPWSGKSVRETLLEQYKTECPCCSALSQSKGGAGREEADIIYTFWVKSAICTNPLCKKEVPLFRDYVIAAKQPSIRYYGDARCPRCNKTFDWEIDPAALIAERSLTVDSPRDSAGIGRGNKRWAFGEADTVKCPWCEETVKPLPSENKRQRKKVPLTVLLCPACDSVWQYRGTLPEVVACPTCSHSYNPTQGNIPKDGWFLCPSCGHTDRTINSIRRLPDDQLLPQAPYAVEGYCASCAGEQTEAASRENSLFGEEPAKRVRKRAVNHPCLLTSNSGKFFKRVTAADLARYQRACETWEREKTDLPYPKQEIPPGEKTKSGLIAHHYRYWYQMFNPRQLLCLATLIRAIDEEPHETVQEMLLSAFQATLNNVNLFCRYNLRAHQLEPCFSRHDFQPKATIPEQNVWGAEFGRGSFQKSWQLVLDAKRFAARPYDAIVDERGKRSFTTRQEMVAGSCGSLSEVLRAHGEPNVHLAALPSQDLGAMMSDTVALVVTDPPYAGNVNYAELTDFFYVWLRLLLAQRYPIFAPEETPKAQEVIENPTRGKSHEDFEAGLYAVFRECRRGLSEGGLMAFTFHHSEVRAWEALLRAVCNAGFEVTAVFPVHGEAESSMHLLGTEGISYDLIHVCRKRAGNQQARSWAGIRQEIRRRAREEIRLIEAGRYGNEPLSPADVNIVLIGKCLELYSRHYGAVVDHEGNPVPLKQALEEIRMMVDQLVTSDRPLPGELEDIDPESYVYLTCLCDRTEIKTDEVHKATRGIMEPGALLEAGLIIKGRAKRGRTYEVKSPQERFPDLAAKFLVPQLDPQPDLFGNPPPEKARGKVLFIDRIHFLIGLSQGGENILPSLERWRGHWPQIRAACEYLAQRQRVFAGPLQKIRDLMDVGPLFQERG